MFYINAVEKIKTHTLCSIPFSPRKSYPLWMSKMCSQRDHKRRHNMARIRCMLDNLRLNARTRMHTPTHPGTHTLTHTHTHTHTQTQICNNYCFSTATMTTRTRLCYVIRTLSCHHQAHQYSKSMQSPNNRRPKQPRWRTWFRNQASGGCTHRHQRVPAVCEISSFRCGWIEFFRLLGYYAALVWYRRFGTTLNR